MDKLDKKKEKSLNTISKELKVRMGSGERFCRKTCTSQDNQDSWGTI